MFGSVLKELCKCKVKDIINLLWKKVCAQVLPAISDQVGTEVGIDHYLWKKITAKKSKNARKDGFINFVDKVLFLRDDSRVIKLDITCDIYYDVDRLDAWLIVAARRHVEEVNLVWNPKEPTELTPLVFTPSSGISKFKFMPNRYYDSYLQLPNSLCLAPMLKSLHLESCKLPKGNSKGEMTLQCSILKNLTIIDCEHGDLKLIDIYIPGLRNLVVENVKDDRNGSCKLKIRTRKLESITLSGCMYQHYSLEYLTSLVCAKFGWLRGCMQAQSLIQVLEGLRHAKLLELFGLSLEPQDMEDQLLNGLLYLRCLKLTHWSNCSCIRTLLNLLRSSRFIETLVVELNQDDKAEEWEEELFPNMFRKLKVAEVRNLKGCDNDLKFLHLLLMNATQLEKLTITMVPWGRQMMLAELGRRIQSLPRASSSITILLF
ncbi:hypothetical protein FRX31_019615 [Thalictrum thalictroides]|uniref:FBD domain-containing protein n=1 Tax=Thalictrum thalictroides TaxID=46969 RepID=A0A7J6W2R1_THATH|nr:hypothetical protein FRX31_019615 [Thalictrum thalictroides]